jgi:hypothetical protein
MKKLFFLCAMFVWNLPASFSQITVTANDVPAANDTLRYSIADPTSTVDLATTGANTNWDFSALTPTSQAIDTYKTATSVSILLALSFATAYGIHTDISGITGGLPLPVSITDVYNFFQKKTGPSRYVGRGYAATISGITMPMAYTGDDIIYNFPLAFNNHDSSNYTNTTTIPSVGALKITGTRHNTVDGWGTIKTPYFTTAVNCLRVRSVIDEVDSITYNSTTIGIPRTTVEYKWLTNGNHYPALYVTANSLAGNEVVSSIHYKDKYQQLTGIASVQPNITQLSAFPNPANTIVTINIPAAWHQYQSELFDVSGKKLLENSNKNQFDISALPSGTYFVRVISGDNLGLVRLAK